ncbi:helix-turn-helix transcriptional regulator [Aggregatilinea lenta]|uniref:helix-turn-helix transcriptional regulator n=1 Tax=Aggregatilinea lenta TaxID=913108 RepID=UPI000E5A1EBE|nr:ArsR family transcriptional regulator [Aggregatilinea lenta]
MQQTRRHILEILKDRKEATIDEIVTDLSNRIGKITAVTVRHHLEILRGDGLVAAPAVRRRSAPGRPQYVYTLTERAADHFPNNYQGLATGLLIQMKEQLPAGQLNKILEGVAGQMTESADVPDASLEVRLDHAVQYMNDHGYTAAWRKSDDGLLLQISNCPYEQVSCNNPELCRMDENLIRGLTGVRPQRMSWQLQGHDSCTYLIREDGVREQQA